MKKALYACAAAVLAGGLSGADLQSQIDAAAAAGGGRVVAPAGETILAGLELKSNVTLEIPKGATLLGSTNVLDYAKGGAVVFASGATNVAIVGEGTIDGHGRSFDRVIARFPHFRMRHGWGTVQFKGCRNVRIEGVTLRGSSGWTCHLKKCDGVDVRRMKIVAHDNYNNDGLDIESSNVRVEDCDIDSEDDALVFKTCSRDTYVTNVVVRNCRLSTNSSYIKFGTESKGVTRDVLVENCDIACRTPIYIRHDHRRTPGVCGTDNSIGGIEVLVVDGGVLENVTVRNVRMGRGIIAPIFVRMGARRDPEPGKESVLRHVLIEDVKMSEPSVSLTASSVTGVPGRRPSDIVIRNVDLLYRGGCERDAVDVPREGEKMYPSPYNVFLSALPAYGFFVRHADGVRLENVKLRVADASEERPPVVTDDATVVEKGVDAFRPDETALANPGEYRLVDPGKTPFPMAKVKEYVFPKREFPITDFGAEPMPEPGTAEPKKCTEAFAKAIAAAHAAGGGRVMVPEGDWLTGAIHLRSNVELHLSPLATIIHTDDPADYLPAVQAQWEGNECFNYSPLVYAFGCTNVAITGRGIFRPRTALWKTWLPRTPELMAATGVLYSWGCTNAPVAARDLTKLPGAKMRPHLLHFNRCANVLLRDFRIEDSPFWVIHTLLCDGVSAKRLYVSVPDGGNRDGMDIDMTRNVIVQDCEFRPGDDVFAMKAGRNADAWRLATPTENVVVRNCLAWRGHALLALGSELSGGLRNIWMHDMTLVDAARLCYLKTCRRRGGFVKNVYLDHAEVEHVHHVFRLQTDYLCQYNKFPDYEQRVTEIDGVHLNDIHVRRANTVYSIHGDGDLPPKNLTFDNIVVDSKKRLSDESESGPVGFKAGFARVDITPPLGSFMPGYYVDRRAKSVLDPLQINCVAFSDGKEIAIVQQFDTEGLSDPVANRIRDAIAKATGVKRDAIIAHASHTHDGGFLALKSIDGAVVSVAEDDGVPENPTDIDRLYVKTAVARAADAAVRAIADLKPAKLSVGRSEAKRISFGRRYLMKDGRVVTNPGTNNPNIVRPVGNPPDEQVQVLRIDREGAKPIAVINFQTHPDVVGGETLTADWPGLTRTVFEAANFGDVLSLVLNGTQGDVNHCNVMPRPGELNGLTRDFDDVDRGYDHAKHMANVIAAAALSVWKKCAPLEAGDIRFGVENVRVPSQKAKPADEKNLKWAEEVWALHEKAEKDGVAGGEKDYVTRKYGWAGMELTTEVARAGRIRRLANGPDFFELPIVTVSIGKAVAFAGFPGEPFNDIGKAVKKGSPFKLTLLSCLTNGSRGYFPFSDAFKEGGYESATSPFGPSVADDLIAGELRLLNRLCK